MASIIQVENLVKKYGDFIAVNGVSFNVENGETFGILGPNGAGKTTTLEMLEGLKGITSGQAVLDGHNVGQKPSAVKSLIGVQLQATSFFDGLNLKELLETFASLYGRKVDAMELLRQVQLEDKAKSNAKELSGGQKQRLSIAAALVNDPKVIFLDEPTTGLDPQARHNLWELVRQIKKQGKTIVLTTHYMEEAEVLCNRIAIMDNAKIIALDTTPNLIRQSGINSSIKFRPGEGNARLEHIRSLPCVESAKLENDEFHIVSSDQQKTLPALFELSHIASFQIFDLRLHQPTLEDVFLKLTGHSLRE